MSDTQTVGLADLLGTIADDLAAWAKGAGGRLSLAESPKAAWDMLASGIPGNGFAAAMFYEGDRTAAEHPRDTHCTGMLTVALLRHPGLTPDRMASHIRDGQRPALLSLVDGLRAHVAATAFDALPCGVLEYQSSRYLQLQDGALANGYALTWQFEYFHV